MPPNKEDQSSWQSILAKALTEFLLSKPVDAAEAARRVAVVAVLSMISFATFTVVRHPEWIAELGPRPRVERNLVQRMAEDNSVREDVVDMLEHWFYKHRPHGLILISWHGLDDLSGVWARPVGAFPEREGRHSLTPDMRVLAGPFVFDECATIMSAGQASRITVACPVANKYDVWGYVKATFDPDEVDVEVISRSMRSLTERISERVYED